MYDHILFPTDGSEGASAALDEARALAELCDATVHVLYSIDTRPPGIGLGSDPQTDNPSGMVGKVTGGPGGMADERESTAELHAEVKARAAEFVETASEEFGDVETEAVVKSGTPHEVILAYADENDIDAIVMGTHGRTGLDKYLLGSVTEKVVRLADVPVLTVRGGGD